MLCCMILAAGAYGVQSSGIVGKIKAEAIRAFVGALYLKRMLAGVFITTV